LARQEALLEVEDLKVHFPLRGTFVQRLVGREAGSVKAVDGVSFELRRGEVLGLVGESGSGKTTLGRAITRLVEPTAGSIRFEGRDVAGMREADFRPLRRRIQIVFQDPHASLNPAMDIGTSVGHPLQIHGQARGRQAVAVRVAEALRRVGLVPPEQFMGKYPTDLSGGQKQRAVLARAVILGPDLLIADEPVSMLDMSVRAKILELMLQLKEDLDLTYVYITHDLATAKFFCDRIAIMYLGRIVEIGPSEAIYEDPKHPYTVSLLRAIPEPDPARAVPRDLPRGEVPDAVNPPFGCHFHPRCPKAFEVCGWEGRDLRDVLEERWASVEEEQYEREQAVVGDLDALGATHSAWLPAGEGARGEDLAELLARVREEQADARLWRGVRGMKAGAGGVAVDFHDGLEPRPLPAGAVEVECHLYDEEAKARAAEYAQEVEEVRPREPV
jgi:oligopeptide/dipeptide ABC transporter ATP-binding protein